MLETVIKLLPQNDPDQTSLQNTKVRILKNPSHLYSEATGLTTPFPYVHFQFIHASSTPIVDNDGQSFNTGDKVFD